MSRAYLFEFENERHARILRGVTRMSRAYFAGRRAYLFKFEKAITCVFGNVISAVSKKGPVVTASRNY